MKKYKKIIYLLEHGTELDVLDFIQLFHIKDNNNKYENKVLLYNSYLLLKKFKGNSATLTDLNNLICNPAGEGRMMVNKFMKLPAKDKCENKENMDIASYFLENYFNVKNSNYTKYIYSRYMVNKLISKDKYNKYKKLDKISKKVKQIINTKSDMNELNLLLLDLFEFLGYNESMIVSPGYIYGTETLFNVCLKTNIENDDSDLIYIRNEEFESDISNFKDYVEKAILYNTRPEDRTKYYLIFNGLQIKVYSNKPDIVSICNIKDLGTINMQNLLESKHILNYLKLENNKFTKYIDKDTLEIEKSNELNLNCIKEIIRFRDCYNSHFINTYISLEELLNFKNSICIYSSYFEDGLGIHIKDKLKNVLKNNEITYKESLKTETESDLILINGDEFNPSKISGFIKNYEKPIVICISNKQKLEKLKTCLLKKCLILDKNTIKEINIDEDIKNNIINKSVDYSNLKEMDNDYQIEDEDDLI